METIGIFRQIKAELVFTAQIPTEKNYWRMCSSDKEMEHRGKVMEYGYGCGYGHDCSYG